MRAAPLSVIRAFILDPSRWDPIYPPLVSNAHVYAGNTNRLSYGVHFSLLELHFRLKLVRHVGSLVLVYFCLLIGLPYLSTPFPRKRLRPVYRSYVVCL